MFRVTILTIGRLKERWLEAAFGEYQKRLTGQATISIELVKDDKQLVEKASTQKNLYALDPAGKAYTSEAFAGLIESAPSRLTFVIGGSEGLPDQIKQAAPLISLSPLTFTHQMTRLILIEQIYRAFEIRRGSKYHK